MTRYQNTVMKSRVNARALEGSRSQVRTVSTRMTVQVYTIQVYAPFDSALMYTQLQNLNLTSAHFFCGNIIGHYSSKCKIVLKPHYKNAEEMRKLCDKVSTLENHYVTVDCEEKYEKEINST